MFKSHGYLEGSEVVCSNGYILDLATLPPFLRTLLVADGTVTKSLEAYFWEPVKVQPVRQCLHESMSEIPGLPDSSGHEMLRREVLLQGGDAQTVYAAARSFLWLDKLDGALRSALEEGKIGIGELLREQGIETYREIVNVDFLTEVPADDDLLANVSVPLVSRSYRIRVSGEPAFLVTEYFPVDRY